MTPEDFMRWRRELTAIRTRIQELSDAIKRHSKTIQSQQESQREGRPLPVIVAYDDQTRIDTKTENEKQHRIQNAIKNWTIRAVFAAVVYAAIAAYQAYEMRRTADLTRQQIDDFEKSQAAFLSIEGFAVGGPDNAQASFVLVNRGNSIATEIGEQSFGDEGPAPNGQRTQMRRNVNLDDIRNAIDGRHARPYVYGSSIAEGHEIPFTFQIPSNGDRWWWRYYEFAYLDKFGYQHTVSDCWVHGYSRVQPAIRCPIEQATDTQKNPN